MDDVSIERSIRWETLESLTISIRWIEAFPLRHNADGTVKQ
jgi:hypothetical protein